MPEVVVYKQATRDEPRWGVLYRGRPYQKGFASRREAVQAARALERQLAEERAKLERRK